MISVAQVNALLHEVRLFWLKLLPIVCIYVSAYFGNYVTFVISPRSP